MDPGGGGTASWKTSMSGSIVGVHCRAMIPSLKPPLTFFSHSSVLTSIPHPQLPSPKSWTSLVSQLIEPPKKQLKTPYLKGPKKLDKQIGKLHTRQRPRPKPERPRRSRKTL